MRPAGLPLLLPIKRCLVSAILSSFLAVLLDGMSFGSLLFLCSVGLSVTLGLMRVINLAHGAFAMAGGYFLVILVQAGLPFMIGVIFSAALTGLLGFLTERVLIRRIYAIEPLDQVLFTFGLTLAGMATALLIFGPEPQSVRPSAWLLGRIPILGGDVSFYRLSLIVLGFSVAAGVAWLFAKTRFGAKVRAAVDNRRAAEGIGIDVDRIFVITFAFGSALAGLGGALAVDILVLEPTFPLRYLTFFLMVVAVGGAGSIAGSLIGAMALGVSDVALKYYVPESGAFVVYAVMIGTLLVFPSGLMGRSAR